MRAGASAVKLEGGRKRVDAIGAILDAEIPVMGHLGLTPQSVNTLGGFRCRARQLDAAREIVDDAVALAEAGVFAIVLECVPDAVARMVTDSVGVPTIGIGAGRHCDGQVLVYHDILGFEDRVRPKFVRRYADLGGDAAARSSASPTTCAPGTSPPATRRTTRPTRSARRSVSTAPSSTRLPTSAALLSCALSRARP